MILDLLKLDFYYINLDEEVDRSEAVKNLLISLGIKNENITRISAIREDGIPQDSVFRGCFLSQLKALKEAKKKNRPFVILEDDAKLNSFPNTIEIPSDSQSVYLGLSSWGFKPSSQFNLASLNSVIKDNTNLEIARVFNMLSSHAISYLDMSYVDKIITSLENNLSGSVIKSSVEKIPLSYYGGSMLPFDVILANLQYDNKVYAIRNPIFYQDGKHEYCTLIKL